MGLRLLHRRRAARRPLRHPGRSPAAPRRAGRATASRRSAARRQPSRRAEPTKLTVTAGPLAGTSLPLRESGILIGRSPECALVLDDDYASGRHARIYHDGTQWFVEDLRSTNGTYLGTMRLTEPEPIRVGSVLRIGQTTVELQR